jgi:PAS domain S-box-containing protein
MRRSFDKGVLAVLGLLLVLTVGDALFAYRNVRSLNDARVRVGQSREVRLALQELLTAAQDAETGVRGYAITGEDRYLDPYRAALPALQRPLRDVERLTADNPLQVRRIPHLRARLDAHRAELDRILAARRSGGFDAARAVMLTDSGKATMDALRREVDAMTREEAGTIEARVQASVHSMDVARASSVFAGIIGTLVIAALLLQMRRNLLARDHAAAVLGEQKELFRTTLASLGEAVAACNNAGQVTFLNAAAEALTRWSAEQAAGQPIDDVVRIVDPAHVPLENSALRVLREGCAVAVGHRGALVARGGEERPIEDCATPLRDAAGALVGAVLVFRDITERKRSDDALRDADRRKDEFLAVLAHELRNPLAPLRNALQVVRLSGNDPAIVEQVWGMMERQVQQMVRLIDDLLDVSRITRNKLELRRETVDTREVVEAALEMSSPVVTRYGHEVSVAIEPGCPALDGDRARLVQVLDNLVTNAAKYSEPGSRIAIAAQAAADGVSIAVKDNGTGIPPDMLDRVFDMFIQVDRSLERSRGGLGIGLTLVRRIVELHGGSVVAKSAGAGLGSEFVVTLPAARAAQAAPALPDADALGSVSRRVLVTDDNVDAAESLASMLRMMGHEVSTAFDGEACVAACEAFRPQVAFVDIGMPRLNGYEAARRIRGAAWGAQVTLIALTGWGQEEDRKRAREAGFDHHVVKPVDFKLLARLLNPAANPNAASRIRTP